MALAKFYSYCHVSVFGVYFYRCLVVICGTSWSYSFVLDASMTNFMFIDVVPLIICIQGILQVVVMCTGFYNKISSKTIR